MFSIHSNWKSFRDRRRAGFTWQVLIQIKYYTDDPEHGKYLWPRSLFLEVDQNRVCSVYPITKNHFETGGGQVTCNKFWSRCRWNTTCPPACRKNVSVSEAKHLPKKMDPDFQKRSSSGFPHGRYGHNCRNDIASGPVSPCLLGYWVSLILYYVRSAFISASSCVMLGQPHHVWCWVSLIMCDAWLASSCVMLGQPHHVWC